jgi:hypothetical protein
MKRGFRSSDPREPIVTKFCRGDQVRTEMSHTNFGGSRIIGLGALKCTQPITTSRALPCRHVTCRAIEKNVCSFRDVVILASICCGMPRMSLNYLKV